MAFENEKTPPFNLEPFLSPKNRRKWLCGKGLRQIGIANGVPKHKIFFGMRFAVPTFRHCKETFRLQPKGDSV